MKGILADLKLFLILTLTSLLILFLDNFNLLNLPKQGLQYLTTPIQYGLYQAGSFSRRQLGFIVAARHAAQEITALKKQLGELMLENASLRTKVAESETLLNQYSTLDPRMFNLLPARVIGLGEKIILDQGETEGVKIGQAVIYKDSFVGEIIAVSPKTSLLQIPQDPASKIAIFSQNEAGKARGVLYGQFNSELLIDKILHQEPLEVGDIVYSEGIEGRLPRGLVIGRISELLVRPNEVFKQAKVEPIFKAGELEIVFIVRGS